MTADLLRERFLDFFKVRNHKIVASDSLVPQDDPTVLFTPAGMNQFKKEFLGFDSGFRRAATCQRCLRTDDLDKVGKTPGHHTFFEMLGNFSFGDYFKKEAISFAWEFLTKELKLEKDRLWVSVYQEDDEAEGIWRDLIKVPAQKIIRLGEKENFWPSEAKTKGPNGPCGPCSEIFFDRGEDIGCQRANCSPACDCGRFVEVWNLVFTQFNRKEPGILEPLPKKNIDTGMGLERLVAVIEATESNFQTSLFKPIIEEIKQGLSPQLVSNLQIKRTLPERELIYAISDHIRAIVFAIFDGVLPSNETRGYVIRKLIRKSSLHLKTLGIKNKPFLYKLVPAVAEVMKVPYPDLLLRRENIAQIILAEEKNFIAILNSSESLFREKFAALLKKPDPEIAAKIAFYLYDTYGIPLELTQDWLKNHNLNISQEVFQQELTQVRNRSKSKTQIKEGIFVGGDLYAGLRPTRFLGYKFNSYRVKVSEIFKDNLKVKRINKGEYATIILEQTVFYPQSGGQVADTGKIIKGKNVFIVSDARKVGNVILHLGKVQEGSFKKNDSVLAQIDAQRRLSIARNHTATHLLQAALRKVLGVHVQQQGSLVREDYLRFDFTHFKDIGRAELDRIEEIVNGYILENYCVLAKQMSLSNARRKGALAFFGEKYASKVRVVSIGDVSLELCGGTHLDSTARIGIFKIISESSVAAGIRRIEAVTGVSAYKHIKEEESKLAELSEILGVSVENLSRELEKRLVRIKELEKLKYNQQREKIMILLDSWIENAEKINEIKIITQILDDTDIEILREAVDILKKKTHPAVIALGTRQKNKALLVIGITGDLVDKGIDAVKLIKDCGGILGGSGGGRKDFAQAGGNKPENFSLAFGELKNKVARMINSSKA
ncbi:MAG: alanine--tRNA ligase [Candidatus Omnitrophica bacterium]|nr:alanine--tRNA ligase [Candidatus Omnitrophota bacterium]